MRREEYKTWKVLSLGRMIKIIWNTKADLWFIKIRNKKRSNDKTFDKLMKAQIQFIQQ